MLRLRHLGSARFAALFVLGAFACAPIVGCGSSTDTGTGDDDTGTTDDSSVDSGGDDTTKPDTGGKDTNVDDTTVPTDTNPPTDTSGTDTTGTDTSGSDTTGTDTTGSDTTGSDTATDVGTDTPTDSASDTPTDSGPTCPSGTKCTTSGGANGICAADNITCAACVDTTDDTKCATAYGAGNICVSGSCVAGNCHSDTGCSSPTPTCGFLTANTCGGCTSDSQCTAVGTICATTGTSAGKCVSNACSVGSATACPANPADICCGGVCVPGTPKSASTGGGCCTATDCAAGFTECKGSNSSSSPPVSGLCTSCTVPTDGKFYVDPVAGNDGSGVGQAGYGGCAFKTVRRALQFIGTTPGAGTQIIIKGGSTVTLGTFSGTTGTGESTTLQPPANVVIMGDTGGATIILANTAGGGGGGGFGAGFRLAAANSGVSNLTIDGGAHVGSYGVLVSSGASATTTTLTNVAIKNTANEGILVTTFTGGGGGGSAGLNIGTGVSVTGAGTTGTPRSGLRLQGNSTVNIPAGAVVTFNANTQHGIEVDNTSSITLKGTPGTTTGTIEAIGNTTAGLFINQQSTGGALPLNTIDGFFAYGTTAGNGIRITAGSNVKIRNTVSLNNTNGGTGGSGVHIASSGFGGSTSLANIDLGKTGDPGKNTFQVRVVTGATPNNGAGICIELPAGAAAQTLAAQGNTFGGPTGTSIDCSATTGKLTVVTAGAGYACTGHVDVGVSNSTQYKVDATSCTYP